MPKLASKKHCTGCMACVDSCKQMNAIDIYKVCDIPYVKIDTSKCIECGLCQRVCPIISPKKKNRVDEMIAFGGWCSDDTYRIKAASGGAFAALALDFLNRHEHAAVVGAVLENNRVHHSIIHSTEELDSLLNSKYIQSSTGGIYNAVLEELKKGVSVLFSGTPCQVAGLYGFMGKRDTTNLYTIDLVCHGVASDEALDIHLKHYNSSHIYSFRDKLEGQYWYKSQRTTIRINNNIQKMERNKDYFYRIFSSWLTDRKSCSNCLYSSLPRVADITLADFWGAPNDEKEFLKGVSLITCNNLKGKELIFNSQYLHKYETTVKAAICSNANVVSGYKFIQYHPLVLFPQFFKRILPNKLRIAILTNQIPWKFLWAPFKILTAYKYKNERKRALKQYNIK